MSDMTNSLVRVRGLSLGAAAALLAACSSPGTVDETSGAQAQAPDQQAQTGRDEPDPGAVDSGSVEGEELADSPGEEPTQASLEAHAGNDRVFFAFDSAELSPAARETLQKHAEWLEKHDGVEVVIEGHTDERGTREYNLALGARRAEAAKNYLVALGISAERLETISYGKERPAVLGSGEEVWRQNRRAVLKVQRPGA